MCRIRQFSLIVFSFLSIALLSGVASAASCCGGGFAVPSLIVGDDQAQLTASYSRSQITDDVGTDQLWRRRTSREISETWKIEAAHIFSDRWQAGASIPVVRRSRAASASSGLGDTSFLLGYEALPDWDYHPWRPKGIVHLTLTAPTGRSVAESEATYQLDSRGRGFWSVGAGAVFSKAAGAFDFLASLETHRAFSRSYQLAGSAARLEPGYGGTASFGSGFNLSDLRLGAALAWTYEDPVRSLGALASDGVAQRFATATLSASYLFERLWAATLSYSDQTKFGAPLNTSLGKSVAFLLQRRWER